MRRPILVLLVLTISISALGYIGSPITKVTALAAMPAPTPTPTPTPAPNRAPVAADDAYSIGAKYPPPLSVFAPGILGNDTDADGDPLTAQLVSGPSHGSVVLQPNGSFFYGWPPGFTGADSFTYRATDGKDTSNPATVFINVVANRPPVAYDDVYTAQGGTLTVVPPGVLMNDKDPDGDWPLTAHVNRPPAHGQVFFAPYFYTGGFQYVAEPGFVGTDIFTYRAQDASGAFSSNEATVTINVTASPTFSSIQCLTSTYAEDEDEPWVDMTVTRTGNVSGSASVDFVTLDSAGLQDCSLVNGIASPRCDFTLATGTLHFAPGETQKVIYISIIDDAYAEGDETFTFKLSNVDGATLGTPGTATITIHDNDLSHGVNPVDDNTFFIRQLYLDFLNREPEPKGLQDWRAILANCQPGSTACDRIEVASAFFRSAEFQQRGYFIYRFYSTVGKTPLNSEFMPDLAKVSGFLTDQQLEANKVAFVDEFMKRPDFQNKYGAMLSDPSAFVNQLLNTTGLPNHSRKQMWIDGLTNGSVTNAQVLRSLVDSPEMYQKYYSEAFVVMSYFGYLRRSADSLYLQWVQTLGQSGGTDYRLMVNGFLNSTEYRRRFGP